jgi:excisionase family DNA binding protein
MTTGETAPEAPLSVREAAERLGISTVRVRQYLRSGQLRGFRDNRGHWRVVPPLQSRERLAAEAGAELSESDAVDLLVDEILELRDTLNEREERLARLDTVVERQQSALDRAMSQVSELRAERDAALARASAGEAESERLRELLARTLERLEDALARLAAEDSRHKSALATLDRALSLLDTTTQRIALERETRLKLEKMLAEATARLELMVDDKAASAALIARREATLERALGLLERMTEADRIAKERQAANQGLITRVMRRLEGNA